MKLIITISEFQNGLEAYINEGEVIKNEYRKLEYDPLKNIFEEWKGKIIYYFDTYLEEENNFFTKNFKQAKPISYTIQNIIKEDYNEQLKKGLYNELLEKISMLKFLKKMIKISDAITIPDSQNVLERRNYTTKQKLELILEKLYDLDDNQHYSISLILELNGIKLKNYGEDREFAKALENNGFIEVVYMKAPVAKISLNGKIYIEEKREAVKENYENISSNPEEIYKKIDEIIFNLQKLGFGQQIIFDEIEELKELYTKVNKKTWGQVLKGKLIDLGLSKLVETDTLDYIYQSLTSNHLKLL